MKVDKIPPKSNDKTNPHKIVPLSVKSCTLISTSTKSPGKFSVSITNRIRSSANNNSSAPDSSSLIYRQDFSSNVSNDHVKSPVLPYTSSDLMSSSVLNSGGRSIYEKHSEFDDIMSHYKSTPPKLVVHVPIPKSERVLRSSKPSVNNVDSKVIPEISSFTTPSLVVPSPVVSVTTKRKFDHLDDIDNNTVDPLELYDDDASIPSRGDSVHGSSHVASNFFIENDPNVDHFMNLVPSLVVDDTDNHSSDSDIPSCDSNYIDAI
jgi:hypothetical protein